MITVRKTTSADLGRITAIVSEAREYFARAGIPQWQGEYPARSDFEDDIKGGRSYVAEEDGVVLGVYCYDTRGDANYNEIFEGAFTSDAPYAAIHRIAVAADAKGRGIAGKMVEHAVSLALAEGFQYMRGDTHRLNLSMQRMFAKNGFIHRGIIYLGGIKDHENERFAFERCIKGEKDQ